MFRTAFYRADSGHRRNAPDIGFWKRPLRWVNYLAFDTPSGPMSCREVGRDPPRPRPGIPGPNTDASPGRPFFQSLVRFRTIPFQYFPCMHGATHSRGLIVRPEMNPKQRILRLSQGNFGAVEDVKNAMNATVMGVFRCHWRARRSVDGLSPQNLLAGAPNSTTITYVHPCYHGATRKLPCRIAPTRG